jgi:N-methylhydantoinase A
MAPVAGRQFASLEAQSTTAVVADTGGTSYDVSLVRRGRIPWSRETWIGRPYFGHMTGFPSVDVRSVGAGGGSIAWVDAGRLLHVGPQSAGADPGPVCYGKGGTEPTVTDACLTLGILDGDYFLGGREQLDTALARAAIEEHVGVPLGLDALEAAAAILNLATERMVSAIEEITIHQGIDPAEAVLVGGGGAAGFNSVAIARRLGCPEVIIPSLGPALSAAGALISDVSRSFEIPFSARSGRFDYEAVNGVLERLEERAQEFIDGPGRGAIESAIDFSVEARYPHQVWELEVPLRAGAIDGEAALAELVDDFHHTHRDVFAVADEGSPIEFESWHARVRCRLAPPSMPSLAAAEAVPGTRDIFLPGVGATTATVWRLEQVPVGALESGPALIESETTTILVDPGATFVRLASGTVHIRPRGEDAAPALVGLKEVAA